MTLKGTVKQCGIIQNQNGFLVLLFGSTVHTTGSNGLKIETKINSMPSLTAPSQLWRLNDEMKLVNQRGSWLFEDISWNIPDEINNGKP